MDKKWKKRMIVNAEKNSERAPSLSAADHFENEQGGLMGQPDVPWVAGLNPGRDKVILCNFSWAIVSERISPKSRLYQHRLSAVSLCPRANAIQWLGYSFTLNSTSTEDEDEPEIPSVFRKKNKLVGRPRSDVRIVDSLRPSVSFLQQNLTSDADLTLDNQKTATYHKKRSNPSSFFNIQNIPDASNNKINEEGPAPKKHRNSARFKVNIEPREPLPSSSTQKYIQFTVTHEYAPMPYTGTVQRLINVDAPNGISDAIGSSVMDYITSNASLLRSNLDFSIFTCDKYLKQTDSNEGISEKNKSYIPESHKSFTKSNNINSEVFKKLFEDELPSQSVTEFEKLNRLLAESEIHRVELLNRYRIVISGESCLKNCVSKIMAHTLSHEVQSAYSGSGKKFRGVKKLNYSKTETYKCLKDVLEEKFGVEYPELKKLKSRVGQWLSNYVSRSK
ncbi:hypothetical protein [Bracoviriform inaniti]|uniref:Uncharacterized protein n=1 Tax=Bracoviriform inaniti TaxID=36344 RepID=O90705_9VIRU|nr:hypothetical protein [Bracoviriform inaniti]CAA83254.2 hypothetical protein [Bracoviriform inaniti]